jgi:hypothetical protein
MMQVWVGSLIILFLIQESLFMAKENEKMTSKCFAQSCIRRRDLINNNSMNILWRMNNAGFFNHVFDFKYVLPFTRNFSRTVIIEPLRSSHYDTDTVLCDYLHIPELKCLRRRSISAGCDHSFQKIIPLIQAKKTNLCFAEASFNRTNLHRQRYHIYLASEPRVQFKQQYVKLFQQIVQTMQSAWPRTTYSPDMFSALNESSPLWPADYRYKQHNFGTQFPFHVFQAATNSKRIPFIVMHWRRGDQLETRCDKNFLGNYDSSPNCATVEELLVHLHHERIRFPPETRFLIATNERHPIVLQQLRRHQYIVLDDLLQSFRYEKLTIGSFVPNATLFSDYEYYGSLSKEEKMSNQANFKKKLLQLQQRQNELQPDKQKEHFAMRKRKSLVSSSVKQNMKQIRLDPQSISEVPTVLTMNASIKAIKSNSLTIKVSRNQHPAHRRQLAADTTKMHQRGSRPIPGGDSGRMINDANSVIGYGARRGKPHPHSLGLLTQMDAFVLESLFMLDATVLINYGISTIHDAIESERYLRATTSVDSSRSQMSSDKDISVCYMVQDPFSWCHAFEMERKFQTGAAPIKVQFNFPPAYPNSALVLPEVENQE